MAKHQNSVGSLVLHRIQGAEPGWVFAPVDFSDLGSRDAVATSLKRYKATGTVRQLARGLYDVPRTHPKVGPVVPSVESVAEAIKRRDSVRLQPTGAYAANLLGLSDQVPLRVVFLTDGLQRRIRLGNLEILLKRTTPRNMATAGRVSGSVIQALRWLGRRNVTEGTVRHLRGLLDPEARRSVLSDLRYAPVWIAEIMRRIAEPRASLQ